jgi:hypothetical protein
MDSPDLIRFASDAMPDREIFCEVQVCGQKFIVLSNAAGEPLAFGYSHSSGQA